MESSGGDGRRGMHLQRMLGGLVVVVVANKKQKQVFQCRAIASGGFCVAWSVRVLTKISVQISAAVRRVQCVLGNLPSDWPFSRGFQFIDSGILQSFSIFPLFLFNDTMANMVNIFPVLPAVDIKTHDDRGGNSLSESSSYSSKQLKLKIFDLLLFRRSQHLSKQNTQVSLSLQRSRIIAFDRL